MSSLQSQINRIEGNLLRFWSKSEIVNVHSKVGNKKRDRSPGPSDPPPSKKPHLESKPTTTVSSRAYKQNQQLEVINDINSKIVGLMTEKSKPFRDIKKIDSEIKRLQNTKKKAKTKLNRLISNAKASKKRREKERETLIKYKQQNPNDKSIIIREKRGRPPVEVWCPGLGAIIQEIVNSECAADPRRRTEAVTYANTLDQLGDELQKRGYHLSRQTTYLRIMPRRPDSIHGRRHVHTVPVKLLKPQEDLNKQLPQTRFCLTEDRMMKQIASYLGLLYVLYAIFYIFLCCFHAKTQQRQQQQYMHTQDPIKLFIVA